MTPIFLWFFGKRYNWYSSFLKKETKCAYLGICFYIAWKIVSVSIICLAISGCIHATKIERMKVAYNTGHAFQINNNLKEAIPQYLLAISEAKKILKKDPSCVDCYLILGNAYLSLSKYDSAIQYLRKGTDLTNDSDIGCQLCLASGHAMFSKSEFHYAYDLYKSVSNSDTKCGLEAKIYTYITALSVIDSNSIMDIDTIIGELENLLCEHPTNSNILLQLARAYYYDNNMDNAWAMIVRAKSIKLSTALQDATINVLAKDIAARKLEMGIDLTQALKKFGVLAAMPSVDMILSSYRLYEDKDIMMICRYIGDIKIGGVTPPDGKWGTIEDVIYPIRMYAIFDTFPIIGSNLTLDGHIIVEDDIVFIVDDWQTIR